MKKAILVITLAIGCIQASYTQVNSTSSSNKNSREEQELIDISKKKWIWMSEKKADTLAKLFHEKSMFVHMGGSWGKEQEIEVIKSGRIWYKKAEVYSASVNIVGNTAILLTDIDLVAVVGGNEVVNPFMVTEVYVKEKGRWKMGSLTFSRLAREVKLNKAGADSTTSNSNKSEEELLALSKEKWQWMADKNVDRLASLFHDQSKFVHMSGTWNKNRELEIIKTGSIWYKKADVHDVTVEMSGDVAVVWNRITLTAVVRGTDAVTEFTVTEVYKRERNEWKMLALTFSSVRDTHKLER